MYVLICTSSVRYTPTVFNISIASVLVIMCLACLQSVSYTNAKCLWPAATVVSWDGQSYPVCSDTHCFTRQHRELDNLPGNRFGSKAAVYNETWHHIPGWLAPANKQLVQLFTDYQHSLGVYGAVGEIGVYYGKYLYAIAGYASISEPVVAMDLFADQSNPENKYDANYKLVLDGLSQYLQYTNDTHIMNQNSMHINPREWAKRSFPPFRYFSVDGGHALEVALNDMNFARCNLAEGGIMVVDDISNSQWMGVNVAVQLFASAQNDLVPFLLVQNKMYFTTPSHHALYIAHVRSLRQFRCTNMVPAMHVSRRSVGKWEVCQGTFGARK